MPQVVEDAVKQQELVMVARPSTFTVGPYWLLIQFRTGAPKATIGSALPLAFWLTCLTIVVW